MYSVASRRINLSFWSVKIQEKIFISEAEGIRQAPPCPPAPAQRTHTHVVPEAALLKGGRLHPTNNMAAGVRLCSSWGITLLVCLIVAHFDDGEGLPLLGGQVPRSARGSLFPCAGPLL